MKAVGLSNMVIALFVGLRNDLPLLIRALVDKHSNGTSPESGLHIYFSASFHFEFKAKPSGDKHDLTCNAAPFFQISQITKFSLCQSCFLT